MLSDISTGSSPPCPAPFNLAGYVLSAGLAVPDKTALLVVGDGQTDTWTYGQLRQAVLGTATGLLESGVTAEAKVLMRLGNTVDFPIAYLASLAIGAVPIPTSTALTGPEVQAVLETVRPEFVLRDPDFACSAFDTVIPGDDLLRFRTLSPAAIHMGSPDRLGYMVFTSGTSGKQRAVCHAHRAIWARRLMFDGWYGLRSDDRVMHAGAFNWTYTLGTGLMDPWTIGATAIIPAAGTPADSLPDLMRAHGATIFAAAPGVYRQMLKSSDTLDLPDLRHGLSAGEKLPHSTHGKWRKVTGKPLLEAYGMSECSTFVSHEPDTNGPQTTLGRPQPGRRIAILKDGHIVPRDAAGTIAIHRSDPGLMLGYFNADHATAERMHGEWFLTGDQGQMDAEGYITYLGRDDDMMNAGGFRVSPIEVENVLLQVPGIQSVAVTEVTVKEGASVIAAFYTGPAPLDETVWRPYVTQNLARYKQPRMFIHQAELPTSANGKLNRRALRDRFES